MKEKIIEMLGHGVQPAMVAAACGVTPAYISQLLSDPSVSDQVSLAKVQRVEQGVTKDRLIDDLETASLKKMKDLLPMLSNPLQAARIFQTVNSAKRHISDLRQEGEPTAPLVQITISAEAAVKFKLSSDRQVVEVEGRSLEALPTQQLTQRLSARREARPMLTDASSASLILDQIEAGIPEDSMAHVL